MTTFLLARHGETEWHAEHRYAGASDIGLTERGRAQAERLAEWAATARLDAIVASTQQRARLTAEPASRATGLALATDPRLVEVDFGLAEGMTPDEIAAAYPEAWADFERRPARHPLPGAEAGVDAIVRALPALDELATAHEGGRVLVVMHATLMRLVTCELIAIDPDGYRDIFPVVDNCALLTLEVPWHADSAVPVRARLLGFNAPPVAGG